MFGPVFGISFDIVNATASVTEVPMSVYQGNAITTGRCGQLAGRFSCASGLIQVIRASEQSIPVITGAAAPCFQKSASNKPPSKAPLVNPRNLKAASSTNATSRLKYATKTNAPAQAIVEILLKRRKKASDRPGNIFLTKSIVETEASEVSAELTEDIAAARMATISKPFNRCGAPVSMKIG